MALSALVGAFLPARCVSVGHFSTLVQFLSDDGHLRPSQVILARGFLFPPKRKLGLSLVSSSKDLIGLIEYKNRLRV